MPRRPKWRCVQWHSGARLFKPAGVAERDLEHVLLTLPGLEVLRLLDLEGLDQQQAAAALHVSRSTVSRMAAAARHAVAEAIVTGKALVIDGGPAAVMRPLIETEPNGQSHHTEGEHMVIAVPYLDGQVNAHFGSTQAFLIARTSDSQVVESAVYEIPGLQHSHRGIAGFLADQGVTVIIAGGMGGPMQESLKQSGFSLYCGVSGDAGQAVEAFLRGEIEPNDATCGHHHGEHV